MVSQKNPSKTSLKFNTHQPARPVATAIAGVKPSDVSALGLSIPSKLKDLTARGSSTPLKGKYGLYSFGAADDDNEERVLVGPGYFTQARLSNKGVMSADYDSDSDDVDDREPSKRPDVDEDKDDNFNRNQGEREVEPVDNSENPYGGEYAKQPIFPPAYEGVYGYLPNPYLPPYNFNLPLPIINQYLQRRNYNAAVRYPSIVPQYPDVYGNPPTYTPFTRYVYV